MNQYTYTLEDLEYISKEIIKNATSKVLCFYGDMGVGKTTLIKQIVKQLGSSDRVTSPTFSLVNEYEAKGIAVYHFDFYRIEHSDEAHQIGLENYLYSDCWCLIEWPDKIKNLLPDNVSLIDIKEQLGGKRKLVLQ
ncbi:tRNA (adenosine(37)-N6)-threonylcarbamoyltransferase complex ATPase subunit type 1 TsaE [Galbibacter sp.]|jgi:tRNA threonylcarbamoyladenosine biosynthesis protein TsaE|uniref:tRNA (adenosine(37)-N6)-threonylcarbamoyltransferase complex ATPase subunit type 1 TsaE n=1 Tax=Galbibacter sp. TaxID=2918471 RepID=UPI003A948E46